MSGIGNFNTSNQNTSFLYGQTQTETEGSSPLSGVSLADFKTSMISLGYTDEQITKYLNNPGQPFLVNPKDSGVTVFDTEKFFENIINHLPTHLGGATSQGEKTYGEAFQAKLDTLLNDPNFLTEIGAKNSDIGDIKIKLALLFPEDASEQMKTALSKLKEGFPSDFPGKADLDQFEKEIGTRQDATFEDLLNKALAGELKDKDGNPIKMDAKDVAALLNAYYNEAPEGLTKEQKVMFAEVLTQAGADLETNFGIPKNLKVPHPGKEYFNTKLNLNFEDEFITKLTVLKLQGDLGMKDGITEQEFNTLRAMIYFKDPENPEQKKLQSQFESLYNQTLSDFKTDNGLPEGWKPDPQVAAGQAFIDGAWRDQFTDNLAKMDIPQEMKNEIMQGLANPAGASPIVKSMIETLVAQTTGEIIESFGLPTTWKPSAKTIDPNVSMVNLLIAKAGIANLKDIYQLGLKALKEMPPGDPMRTVLMDYLKKIGDALNKLQESMYLVQSSSAKTAKVLAAAMSDMQKNKIDEQAKQADKAREQRNSKGYKKSHDPGKKLFMLIFSPIMAIILLLLALMTGGMLMFLFIGLATFMAASSLSQAAGGPDLIQKLFEGIGQLIEIVCKAMGFPPELISAIKLIVKILFIIFIAVIGICCGGGIIGQMVLMTFLMDAIPKAGIGKDLVQTFNRNASAEDIQKAEMAVMIIMMVVMMTVMIVQTVLMTVLSGGTAGVGVGVMIGTAAARITAAVAQVSATVARVVAWLIGRSQMFASFCQFVMAIVKVVVKHAQSAMRIVEAAIEYVRQFVTDCSKMVAKQFQAMGSRVSKIGDTISKVLERFISSVGDMAPDSLENSVKAVTEKIGRLVKQFTQAIEKVVKFVKQNVIAKKLEEFVEELRNHHQSFMGAGKQQASSSVSAVADDAASLLDDSEKAMEDAFESMDDIARMLDDIGDASEEVSAFEQGISALEDTADVVETGIQTVTKKPPGTGIAKIADYAHAGSEVAQGVQGMVSGITQAQYAQMMAELVKLQARSDAFIEEVDAMIKLLKKVIESLLDAMQPAADFINDISNLQAKKYTDATAGGGWNAVA